MRAAVLGKNIASVSTRVRRYGDELDLLFHRRLIDHGLDFGDALRVQRAYVRTIRVDEVQDNDLAAEIGQADGAAVGALQYEAGRVLVDRLEISFSVAQGGLELLERVSGCQRRNRRQRQRDYECPQRWHSSSTIRRPTRAFEKNARPAFSRSCPAWTAQSFAI